MDDIVITGNDKKEKQIMSYCLAKEFEMKALGRLKYFLDIEVTYSKKGIFISQQKYILYLLKETSKSTYKLFFFFFDKLRVHINL